MNDYWHSDATIEAQAQPYEGKDPIDLLPPAMAERFIKAIVDPYRREPAEHSVARMQAEFLAVMAQATNGTVPFTNLVSATFRASLIVMTKVADRHRAMLPPGAA